MRGPGPFTNTVNKEVLTEMFVNQNMTMTEIAAHFGCCLAVISIKIKQFGLKTSIHDKYINKEFDQLTPFEYTGRRDGRSWYNCLCSCGKIFETHSCSLISGNTKSCGCTSRKKGKNNKYWNGYEEITKTLFDSYRKGAIRRGLVFDISIEDMWNQFIKQDRKCALTGLDIIFAPTRDRELERTASLDRIDSRKGYILDNIQWLHKDLNAMKWDFTEDYFIEMCRLIVSNIDKSILESKDTLCLK